MDETRKSFWEVINEHVAKTMLDSGEAERLLVFSALCRQLEAEMNFDFFDSYIERHSVAKILPQLSCCDLSKLGSRLDVYIKRRTLKGQASFNELRFDEQCKCMCHAHQFSMLFFMYADSQDKRVQLLKHLFE